MKEKMLGGKVKKKREQNLRPIGRKRGQSHKLEKKRRVRLSEGGSEKPGSKEKKNEGFTCNHPYVKETKPTKKKKSREEKATN